MQAPDMSLLRNRFSQLAPDPGAQVQAALLLVFKGMRLMVLWIALYMLDRVWQDAYVQHLVANEGAGDERREPPSLLPIIVLALGVEALAMLLLLLVLWLLRARFGGAGSTFLIDQRLLALLGADYLATTALLLVVGVAVSGVVQDTRLFRYRDDGMRAIRADCTLLLLLAGPVLLLPMHAVV